MCDEVHRHLGPGLLESIYESALCIELRAAGLKFRRLRLGLTLNFNGEVLHSGIKNVFL